MPSDHTILLILISAELTSLPFTGALLPLAFSLSLAAHLSLYPALLLPPLILVAAQSQSVSAPAPPTAIDAAMSKETAEQQEEKRRQQGLREMAITAVGAFAGHQLLVLGLSWWITGESWAFLSSVYGVT